jgi:HEAT repeat protein
MGDFDGPSGGKMMSKALLTLGFLSAGLLTAWAADEKEVEEALQKFKKGMANPSAPARASAVAELATTKSEKTAATLGGLLGADTEPVRKAAALGLGGFTDYKKIVTPMLLAGLNANAKEPKVEEAIFQALGKLDDDAALTTIHGYFEDKDAVVAAAALMSAAEIRNLSSIDLIVNLMKKYEKIDAQAKNGGGGGYGVNVPGGGGTDPKQKLAKDVLPATVKAMQKISGEKWTTVKEWEIWWSKHKATFKIDNK